MTLLQLTSPYQLLNKKKLRLIAFLLCYLFQVSMNLYLVHEPLIRYLTWVLYGTLPWPAQEACVQGSANYDSCTQTLSAWNDKKLMPPWGVAIILPIGLMLATFLLYYVEEPSRKALRAKE